MLHRIKHDLESQKFVGAMRVVNLLREYGEAYIVGGTVRDLLLGIDPNDIDIATNLNINKIIAILKDDGLSAWNIKFEVVGVSISGKNIEISSFKRFEHLWPVRKTLREDLRSRDFTINAMAIGYNNEIIDIHNGLEDIDARIIKATNMVSLREDPLRMLRAVRFVSTLGFSIEENTRLAIESLAHTIINVSKERCFHELNRLLLGNNVEIALELLFETRLLGFLLPEVYPITMMQSDGIKNIWDHTKQVIGKIKPTSELRWAALLHDIGKPQTFRRGQGVHFFGHEILSCDMAKSILDRLRAGHLLINSVSGLILLHHRIANVVSRESDPSLSLKALRRIIRDCDCNKCNIKDLVELFSADCSSTREEITRKHKESVYVLWEALNRLDESALRPRLPKSIGTLIMERFKLEQGREVGVLRTKLDSMLLSGEISENTSAEGMIDILEKEIGGVVK